jgi:hypothetical protein
MQGLTVTSDNARLKLAKLERLSNPSIPQCPDLTELRMPPTAIDSPSSSDRAVLTMSCPSSVEKSTNCPLTKISFTFGFGLDFLALGFNELGTEDCLDNIAHLLYSLILSGVAFDKSSLSFADSGGVNDALSSLSIDALARVS